MLTNRMPLRSSLSLPGILRPHLGHSQRPKHCQCFVLNGFPTNQRGMDEVSPSTMGGGCDLCLRHRTNLRTSPTERHVPLLRPRDFVASSERRPCQPLHICAMSASPKAEHDSKVASSIRRSKSYVTVFALIAPSIPLTIKSAASTQPM